LTPQKSYPQFSNLAIANKIICYIIYVDKISLKIFYLQNKTGRNKKLLDISKGYRSLDKKQKIERKVKYKMAKKKAVKKAKKKATKKKKK